MTARNMLRETSPCMNGVDLNCEKCPELKRARTSAALTSHFDEGLTLWMLHVHNQEIFPSTRYSESRPRS